VIVLLDSGPLGLLASSTASPESHECNLWLRHLLNVNYLVIIPEIVDYELRRELLRGRMRRGPVTLESLAATLMFAPISTPVMRQAAEFWAIARQRGGPTADDKALDVDMILAAQAHLVAQTWEQDVVIATTNVRHLTRFAPAREWREVV
jgi:predicted nucleic acid-binding protein